MSSETLSVGEVLHAPRFATDDIDVLDCKKVNPAVINQVNSQKKSRNDYHETPDVSSASNDI